MTADQIKKMLEDRATQEYNDSLAQLAQQESNIRASNEAQQGLISKGLENTMKQSLSQRLLDRQRTQQNRLDAQKSNRMRARAIGGGTSSGFLDLTGRTDQQATQNMFDIDSRAAGFEGNAQLEAQKGLQSLQSGLQDALMKIEADRSLSRRNRDDMMNKALEAYQAQLARSGGAGGGGGMMMGGDGNVLGASTENNNANQPEEIAIDITGTNQAFIPITNKKNVGKGKLLQGGGFAGGSFNGGFIGGGGGGGNRGGF